MNTPESYNKKPRRAPFPASALDPAKPKRAPKSKDPAQAEWSRSIFVVIRSAWSVSLNFRATLEPRCNGRLPLPFLFYQIKGSRGINRGQWIIQQKISFGQSSSIDFISNFNKKRKTSGAQITLGESRPHFGGLSFFNYYLAKFWKVSSFFFAGNLDLLQ